MSYLLGITIGPVQAFIEESKKLRDLENSSRIISDLMKKINKFIKENNGVLIYPNINDNLLENIYFSNYAVYKCESIIQLANLEKNIYKEKTGVLQENFHIFWAYTEFTDSNYIEKYTELSRIISNIKNTYKFEFATQKSGKKCLICGKRNISDIKNDLCPLCEYKRAYLKGDSPKYDSVYSIAIKKWKNKYKEKLKNFKNNLIDVEVNPSKIDKYYSIDEINNLLNIFTYISKNINCNLNLYQVINRYKNKYNFEIKKLIELKEDLKDKGCSYNALLKRL